ncbi:MAG: OB-fold nucleic acid binding domain-containing protein, partial [Pseudonocardiaceae bacterium]
ARQSDTPIASILDGTVADGAQVIVGGILASVTRRVNRNGEPWTAAQLEDLAAGIEVLFFPKTYSVVGVNVVEDVIVLVKARVTKRDDRISLIANDLVVPDLVQANGPAGIGQASTGQAMAPSSALLGDLKALLGPGCLS